MRSLEKVVKEGKSEFWAGKRVLLTGHTGFKGSWLAIWLTQMGADVTGVALRPSTSPSLYTLASLSDRLDSRYIDICSRAELRTVVTEVKPDILFHLAAQPLVRASYHRPVATFETNIMGTVNLLDALRDSSSVRVAVMITTDKVYRNDEHVFPYRESDALGGHDPYSASKAASEIVISSYRDSYFAERDVAIASARAGNVIGGGDWSADRLIPDAVRAWQSGGCLDIRRPEAVRPWQHVLEPLFGYLSLAERLWDDRSKAGAYNFGPEPGEASSVRDVIELARQAFGSGEMRFGAEAVGLHEAGLLSLEIAKARAILKVRPRWPLRTSVERTMAWYRALSNGSAALDLCIAEIAAYEQTT